MSKTKLTHFLKDRTKEELQEQVLDLYQRFKNVKEFYDFSFNPNEEKRIEEAKLKITKEYFPEGRRRAKKRRSVAQKAITHLKTLEVTPELIADLMLYNLEVAQSYTVEMPIKQMAFYKSMLKSYQEAISYIDQQYLKEEFESRVLQIKASALDQQWPNAEAFQKVLEFNYA